LNFTTTINHYCTTTYLESFKAF